MLIRQAMLMTMTKRGAFRGDVCIRGGVISEVGECVSAGDEDTVLDGSGLWVMPGMIDLHVSCSEDEPVHAAARAMEAGVTGGLLCEAEGRCWRFSGRSMEPAAYTLIRAREMTRQTLMTCMRQAASSGMTCACEIRSMDECRTSLAAAADADARPLLIDLYGCASLAEDIAASGCPVVTGVGTNRTGCWRLAARLDALGGIVAVSCRYPLSQFRFLADCAALCVREGMPPERALMAVTAAPALLLGMTDAGCIASGYRANLAVFDGDPLLLASSLAAVILQGKLLKSRIDASRR